MRALYAVVPETFENDSTGKKAEWREQLERKLREMTKKEAEGSLVAPDRRHSAYKGADGLVLFDAMRCHSAATQPRLIRFGQSGKLTLTRCAAKRRGHRALRRQAALGSNGMRPVRQSLCMM